MSSPDIHATRRLNNATSAVDLMRVKTSIQKFHSNNQSLHQKQRNEAYKVAEFKNKFTDTFTEIIQNASEIKVVEFDEFKKLSQSIALSPPKFDFSSMPPLHVAIQNSSSGSGLGCGAIWQLLVKDIPEDSIFRKLLACIPIIGIIPTVINEKSLRNKINEVEASGESNYLCRLINVKNHYKYASIVRESLTLALIITGVARNVLSSPIWTAAGIIAGGCVTFYAYEIYKNEQIISQVQGGDLSSKMHVR